METHARLAIAGASGKLLLASGPGTRPALVRLVTPRLARAETGHPTEQSPHSGNREDSQVFTEILAAARKTGLVLALSDTDSLKNRRHFRPPQADRKSRRFAVSMANGHRVGAN